MAEKPAACGSRIKQSAARPGTNYLPLFTSMRTGLGLLMLLIALSLAGTLFWPGIYHTTGFRLVIGLLGLNTFLCSCRRVPSLWLETFGLPWFSPALTRSWPANRSLATPAGEQEAVRMAETLLMRRGFRVKRQPEQKKTRLYAVKGRAAPWGTLAVHISLLLIIGGAVYGRHYGFCADAVLAEGKVYTLGQRPGLHMPVNLRLNNFTTSYNQDGTVSDWISDISLERNGQEIVRRRIKVNEPLNYEGIMIYQMSYGRFFQTQLLNRTGAVDREAELREREKLTVDQARGLEIQPVRFTSQGRVLYVIHYDRQPVAWGTAAPGEQIPLGHDQGAVRFAAVVPFSGLQLKRDPGVPWVWSGFILLTTGFFLSIYTRRSRLWLTVTAHDRHTVIKISGRDKQNTATVENIYAEISKALNLQPKEEL